jgi:hypothetical protein
MLARKTMLGSMSYVTVRLYSLFARYVQNELCDGLRQLVYIKNYSSSPSLFSFTLYNNTNLLDFTVTTHALA